VNIEAVIFYACVFDRVLLQAYSAFGASAIIIIAVMGKVFYG
jgi:hypothetical protein